MAAPISYENMKQITELFAGRSPIIYPQDWVFGGVGSGKVSSPPTTINDGIEVNDNMWAVWGVRNWRDNEKYRLLYHIHTYAVAPAYGVEFFGAAPGFVSSVAGNTDAPTTIADLKAVLDVLATYIDPAATAAGCGGSAEIITDHTDMLELSLDYVPPFGVYATFANEDSVLIGNTTEDITKASLIPEATQTSVRLWGLDFLGQWRLVPGAAMMVKGPRGFAATKISGFTRIYTEVVNTDGMCLPAVGWASLEQDQATLEQNAAALWDGKDLTLYQTIANNAVVRSGLGLPVDREPGEFAHTTYITHHAAPSIKRQYMVSVTAAAVVAIPANPARRGFIAQPQGGGVFGQYAMPSPGVDTYDTAANFTSGGFQMDDLIPLGGSGEDTPGNALLLRANGAGPVNVFIMEW